MTKRYSPMVYRILLISVLTNIVIMLVACSDKEDPAKLETLEQKVNYAVAYNFVSALKSESAFMAEGDDFPVEPEAFSQAIIDKQNGIGSRFTEEEAKSIIKEFQERNKKQNAKKQDSFSELLSGIGKRYSIPKPEERIIGTWINTRSGAPLRLFPDGSGFFYQLPSTWSLSKNSIRIKINNADGSGSYRLDGDRLTISGFSFMHELNGSYKRSD